MSAMIKNLSAFIAAAWATQLSLPYGAASAADLGSFKDTIPVSVPAPIWAGWYFGGHAGGARSDPKVMDTFTYIGDPTVNAILGRKGFTGGVQAGYNFQRGHFVFGPEADIGHMSIRANKSFFQPGDDATCQVTYPGDVWPTMYGAWNCNIAGKYSISGGLYGDLTTRVGYEMDRLLLYAKGGAALMQVDFKANYSGNNCTVLGPYCYPGYDTIPGHAVFNFDHSETFFGWTVGAGVEYALSPSWSIKAEYQHFDFGKKSYSYYGCYGFPLASGSYPDPSYGKCPAGAPAYDNHYTSTLRGKTEVSITADAVWMGISYHFNSEAPQRW
jgi:outer membrane immunogenic protein